MFLKVEDQQGNTVHVNTDRILKIEPPILYRYTTIYFGPDDKMFVLDDPDDLAARCNRNDLAMRTRGI